MTQLRTKERPCIAPDRPLRGFSNGASLGGGTRRVGAAPGSGGSSAGGAGRPRARSGKRLRAGRQPGEGVPGPGAGSLGAGPGAGGTRREKGPGDLGEAARHARRLLTSCRGSGGRSALPGPALACPGEARRRRPRAPVRPGQRPAPPRSRPPQRRPRLWPAPAARGGGGLGSARAAGTAPGLGPAVRAPWPRGRGAAGAGKAWSRPPQPPPQLLAGGSRRAFGLGSTDPAERSRCF